MKPGAVVQDMLDTASDGLPERWQPIWHSMDVGPFGGPSGTTLKGWLEETYFDGNRREDLTQRDIVKIHELVSRMLWFEPSSRASAAEIVRDAFFKGE